MERLTDWTNEEKTEVSIRHDRFRDAMIRLAAYEDTGLEPCEIPVLLDRLKRASEQWDIWCDAYQNDVPVWIPVEERLPEKGMRVLVTCDDGVVRISITGEESKITGNCIVNGFPIGINRQHEVFCVIAWIPLPEPYMPQN